MRQQLRAALDELKALKDTKVAPEKKEPPAAESKATGLETDSDRRLREIETRERLRDLEAELGLGDKKQSKAVLDLMQQMPGLAPTEALELAAKRNAELFKERASGGFDANVHGSLRPRPGAQPVEPKPSEHKQRVDHMNKLFKAGHKQAAEEYAVDLIAAKAAEAIGWEYKRKPLPS